MKNDRQVKAIIRAFCRAMKPPEADSIADIAEPIAEYQPCGLEHIELPDSLPPLSEFEQEQSDAVEKY